MIRLVSRQNMAEFFPLMESGLKRALTKTSLGLYWDLDKCWDNMVNFGVYGFYQEESQYSGIFYLAQAPLRKTLHVFWAGKDPENTTPIDYQEVTSFFEACAKYFECQSILVEGRKGWEKVGSELGYLEDSRSYVKNLE